MIKEINDIDLINELLAKFNVSIKSIDAFSKYLVYEDSEILGFINYSIIYERSEINYIYTFNKFRNKKIASKLLKYMEEDCYQNNCYNITLEVRIDNDVAIAFYKKNKFKEIGIRKNYYNGIDAILMEKVL